MGLSSIREVMNRADRMDRSEGMVAYQCYHDTLQIVSALYDEPFPAVVGAFSALSPNNDYIGNLRSLRSLLDAKRAGRPLSTAIVTTYRACAGRAWRSLHGEGFLSFTKGPKTSAFYQCIINPTDPNPVVVDGHMVSAWAGQRMTMVEAARVMRGLREYKRISDDIRTVARERHILPMQTQAVCWFTWKRMHEAKYTPQLKLFEQGDPWQLRIGWDKITPFGVKGEGS